VWDLNTGRLLNTLEDHDIAVNSVATSPDNSKIVYCMDNTIKVWDLDKKKYHLTCKFDDITSFSKSLNLLALGNSLGDLYVGSLFAQNFDSR
jgi:WD40 repeat protein